MNRILVGRFDHVLGTVGVDTNGKWVLEPQNRTEDATDELLRVVERVFRRVRRRHTQFTRTQFIQRFYDRKGPPAEAYAMSAWGKLVTAPTVLSTLQRLLPDSDADLLAVKRYEADLLTQLDHLQRA